MKFRRFGHAELVATFEALDSVATIPRRVVVFGGTAIALYTGSNVGTSDVDYQPPSLDDLIAQVADRDLPTFSMPAIAEFPYNYEARLHRVLPELARLQVFLPEPHDLALSKMLRWYVNDESHVRELHRVHRMSVVTLVERYRTEMDHVMGDPRRIDANFLELIDALFGEIAAQDAREGLKRR